MHTGVPVRVTSRVGLVIQGTSLIPRSRSCLVMVAVADGTSKSGVRMLDELVSIHLGVMRGVYGDTNTRSREASMAGIIPTLYSSTYS